MSIHISAAPDKVAPTVIMPGDPRRGREFANEFLEDVVECNYLRNESGYTGRIRGTDREVTIQPSGMGQPTLAIYRDELVQEYGVRRIIRVGSCGVLQPSLGLREIVIVSGSYYLPGIVEDGFLPAKQAAELLERIGCPQPDAALHVQALQAAQRLGIAVHVGTNLAVDKFYHEDPDWWKPWTVRGVLTLEMESWELFYRAPRLGYEALTINTASDYVPGVREGAVEAMSSEDRATQLGQAARIALELVL